MPGSKALGGLLRSARERAGLTQAALAETVGLAPNHLVRLESGEKSNPRFETVALLAAQLGLSLDDLAAACGYRTTRRDALDASALIRATNTLKALSRKLADATTEVDRSIVTLSHETGADHPRSRRKRSGS